jgi:hypothetical protein
MKKALIVVLALKTILTVVAVVALILAVCVQDNDVATIRLAISFLSSSAICIILALVEDMLKNQIDRRDASVERKLQKVNDRMFCDVKPFRDGSGYFTTLN